MKKPTSIRIEELNLTLSNHFLERCSDRKVATWDKIITDLKDIDIPRKGDYKVYTHDNCYIIKNRVLVTCYKKPTSIQGLVVKL